MKHYDGYKLVAPYYGEHVTEDFYPLDFTKLIEATQKEGMIPLDAAGMQSHPLGLAMVHAWVSGHGFFHKEPVAYTGITGFKEYEGKKLAIVGGVITLPAARGKKLGHMTVGGLLEIAASDDSTAQYGHEGFIAKCNENSEGLFLNHGFEVIALEEGKTVMMKEI